jgi:hypothetical protein
LFCPHQPRVMLFCCCFFAPAARMHERCGSKSGGWLAG